MLSNFIGALEISTFPVYGLVIFFTVFVAICGWVFFAMSNGYIEAQSHLPFEDDSDLRDVTKGGEGR